MLFCAALNMQLGGQLPQGYYFCLPTEAQWEYACRAGTTTPFSFGSVLDGTQANCDGSVPYGVKNISGPYQKKTTVVGSYAPNAWGLYDMHGNVWEWCYDRYDAYPDGAVTDPIGGINGSDHVNRGGSWRNYPDSCRAARRDFDGSNRTYASLGFRLALVPSLWTLKGVSLGYNKQ